MAALFLTVMSKPTLEASSDPKAKSAFPGMLYIAKRTVFCYDAAQ